MKKPEKIRVAINGFGRIGRTTFKAILSKSNLQVVAINDLTEPDTLAHLLQHDTSYRLYNKKIKARQGAVVVDGKSYRVFAQKDPAKLPWKKLRVDVVLECTGRFRTKEEATKHIKAGAKQVIISAPAQGGGVPTLLLGVNETKYKGEPVINMGSCTTNCIAPVIQIMCDKFGVKSSFMTTVHSYTADQNLQDGPHKDLRRARAAAANIVPTTTGAAIATTEAIPELKNRFDGMAIRVPNAVVSISDFSMLLKKKVTVDQINKTLINASKNSQYRGILGISDDPLVSTDYVGNEFSGVVDLLLTKVVDGNLVKIVVWYDNEWAYSLRLAEMSGYVGRKIKAKKHN
ncbi:type I glyceraldehyde-3-phosphate dehydrogenase [Patescibacteria group bacterium]|nr:type I glyceraldehyde-3-phosphate dehydrogenase [Patescibacteria group bacterium]MBU1890934.1 type I glyceraldehyde-3-phosphate dehydrogenase [Patescibacteria group bacterium]